MIEGIRRRFRPVETDPWDADRQLGSEASETTELPTDAAVLVAATHARGEFSPEGADRPDYYTALVNNAIENGGRLGDHTISVPWLRMILAGLEMRRIEPETMWYDFEAEGNLSNSPVEIPRYEDLFPGERDVPARMS